MRGVPRALKIVLLALGALAAVLALAALAVALLVDVDAYKPRVEAAASDALGMDVTVEGRLRIGFIPGLNVSLEKVRIRNRDIEVALVQEAKLSIGLFALFRGELSYGSIALNRARLSVERDRNGRYNYEGPTETIRTFPPLDLQRITLSDVTVVYTDRRSTASFDATNCNGEFSRVQHPGGSPFLARLSLSGKFACHEVHVMGTTASDLALSVEAKEGVFDFKPVTMRVFGGQGSGSVHVDRSAAIPVVHLTGTLSRLRIEEVFKALPPGTSVSGAMDFSIILSMRGRTREELRSSADGTMSLSGTNLTVAGVDLDRQLSKYESSQNFNLFDVSAILLAGPVGLALSKGYQFSGLLQQEGGATQIRTLVSRWKVEKGVARALDVALATRDNRLALRGGLDFVDDEFDEVFLAVIDANGCAMVTQRIRGPFSKPVVEKPGVMASLAGPVANLLGRAKELISGTGGKCEVFYNGSVAPPK